MRLQLFVNTIPEGTHEVQVANFADCRTEVATTGLYTNFLVANLYQVVDDFAQEGFTQYHALYAIGVSAGGKGDFSGAGSQVENFFAFNFIGNDDAVRQSIGCTFNVRFAVAPFHIGEVRYADEAEYEFIYRVVVNIKGRSASLLEVVFLILVQVAVSQAYLWPSCFLRCSFIL